MKRKRLSVAYCGVVIISLTLTGCSFTSTADLAVSDSSTLQSNAQNELIESASDSSVSSNQEISQVAQGDALDSESTPKEQTRDKHGNSSEQQSKTVSSSSFENTSRLPSSSAAQSQSPVRESQASPEKPNQPLASNPTSPPQTSKPEPTKPEPSAFDVNTWVAYAKNYGQSIGLNLDSTATSCWDNPITANSSCIYLERDLKGMLDWYKDSGMTGFWVWSENLGADNYLIYIGYA